ncbi:MAG: S24/S26 family peptidase [Clostridia bacterium]|nr:S24/S26 family peptidase [Clostridia bacterium]
MEEKEVLTIEQVLEKEGKYIGPTVGVSMLPMLKTRRDSIVVTKKDGRLKPLDVALYKRGEHYILHRVLKVTDTGYIIRGDNCYADEIVPEECILGVLTEFFRKDEHYFCDDKKYLRYVRRRLKSYPVRRFYVRVKGKIKRIVKKILGKK